MSILEIENAIKQLPPEKVNELMLWFVRYHAEVWEEEIANDLDSGRLDGLISDVESEIASDQAEPL